MRQMLLTAAFTLAATLTHAGEASERVFSRTAMDLVKASETIVYSHVRSGVAGEQLQAIDDGEIRVAMGTDSSGGRESVVTMGEVGKLRPVSRFPASSGNPLVPIFLESALRTMSRVTGGSTFYIRNRIKDSLGTGGTMTPVEIELDGKTVPSTEIVFEPFLNDKNRDRMGPFADLRLTFVVSDTMPGDIIQFAARTGQAEPFYAEEIKFRSLVQGD